MEERPESGERENVLELAERENVPESGERRVT